MLVAVVPASTKSRRRATEPVTAAVAVNASAAPAGSESAFVSVAAFPTRTVPGGGGGGAPVFDVVTVIVVAVLELPAASRATALSVCDPFATVVESHVTEYGAEVSSRPRLAPSSLNCTPATPTLSDAFAETATAAPETVEPAAGAVSETVGGVGSGGVVPPLPLGRTAM